MTIPLWLISPGWTVTGIIMMTMIYTISEILRLDGFYLPIISDITLMCAREEERVWFIASPVYYSLGILLMFVAFPPQVALIGVSALTLADTFATIIGIRFGTIKLSYNRDKSIQGSIGSFLVALTPIIIIYFIKVSICLDNDTRSIGFRLPSIHTA